MLLHRWLQNLSSTVAIGLSRRQRRQRNLHRATTRGLNLEMLEDRRLMAFTPAVSYPIGGLPVASWVQSQPIVTADFNNDGVPDVVVGDYHDNGGLVTVLLGIGNGSFEPALNSRTGEVPLSIAVGDFDGDGNRDLATANAYDVTVLMGNGDGTFQAPTTVFLRDSEYPQAVAVGDFNGDGLLDLGVTSNTYQDIYYYGGPSYASVLLGQGDGSFLEPKVTRLDDGYHYAAVAAKLNGDAYDDFVTVNAYTNTGNVLLGGNSGFLQGGPPSFVSYSPGDPLRSAPRAVAAGDLDADGDTDLVVANVNSDKVNVLLGNGAGGFSAATHYVAGWYATGIIIGDFTGDGHADVATSSAYYNNLTVLPGKGDGTLLPGMTFPVGSDPSGVAAGDFNSDGWLDAAVSNNDGAFVSVLVNDQSWPSSTPPPLPSVSINDVTVSEGNLGEVIMAFQVTLSFAGNIDVTVQYATADITAEAGSDYTAASGTVVVPAGSARATFTVAVISDRLPELAETFAVNLSNPINVKIADGHGVGTIVDDEPRISITDVTKKEGNGKQATQFTFAVTLSVAYDQPVTISFRTVDGTATTSDRDYIDKFGTLTFAPGEISKTITIEVARDRKKEENEYFYLELFGNSDNSVINKNRGIGMIVNDD